jgi:hypothetical protein
MTSGVRHGIERAGPEGPARVADEKMSYGLAPARALRPR